MARARFIHSSWTPAATINRVNAKADMPCLAHLFFESSNSGVEAPATRAVRPTRRGKSSTAVVCVCGRPGISVL